MVRWCQIGVCWDEVDIDLVKLESQVIAEGSDEETEAHTPSESVKETELPDSSGFCGPWCPHPLHMCSCLTADSIRAPPFRGRFAKWPRLEGVLFLDVRLDVVHPVWQLFLSSESQVLRLAQSEAFCKCSWSQESLLQGADVCWFFRKWFWHSKPVGNQIMVEVLQLPYVAPTVPLQCHYIATISKLQSWGGPSLSSWQEPRGCRGQCKVSEVGRCIPGAQARVLGLFCNTHTQMSTVLVYKSEGELTNTW